MHDPYRVRASSMEISPSINSFKGSRASDYGVRLDTTPCAEVDTYRMDNVGTPTKVPQLQELGT
jgi:hypothetical protein